MLTSNTTHKTDQQDDLATLAETIRGAHQAVRAATVTALRAALDAGEALLKAQTRITPGGWQAWLKTNCFLSVRTAELYQQLARHRAEIETELTRVPELSLRAARKLIAKPQAKPITAAAPSLCAKLTKALRAALSHSTSRTDQDRASALAGLNGIRNVLASQGLDLHDVAIVIKARTRARRAA